MSSLFGRAWLVLVGLAALVLSACGGGASGPVAQAAAEPRDPAPVATTAPLVDVDVAAPTSEPATAEAEPTEPDPTAAPIEIETTQGEPAATATEPPQAESTQAVPNATATDAATPVPAVPTVEPTAVPAPPTPEPTAVPEPAPILVPELTGQFNTIAGGQIDLGSLQGSDVVLWFWAPW